MIYQRAGVVEACKLFLSKIVSISLIEIGSKVD